jgi:hypothetical protein
VIAGQAAMQNIVQTLDAGAQQRGRGLRRVVSDGSVA